MIKKLIFLLLLFELLSCQKIEILDEIVFDFDQVPEITINAKEQIINNLYELNFNDPYIDHSLKNSPKDILYKWFNNNVNIFGTENKFVLNILDASLKKTEIMNINSKKYQEKTIFLFDVSLLVEFILLDDSNLVLANSIVEAKRTTTSSKFISLYESERIIDTLIYDCLIDFTKKTDELLKLHMKNFIL